MGMFESEEAGDIMYDSHDVQITDEPADVMRQRASSHRGAAYHDPYYPPHGASGGQEGGSMRPEETIEIFGVGADVVFGKNYARGLDILGAVTLKKPTKRAGFVAKETPGGRTIISLNTSDPKTGNHVAVIKNARDVGKHAMTVGGKLLHHASRAPAPRKVAAKPKTAVRGTDGNGDFDILGAIKRAISVKRSAARGSGKKRFTPAQAKKVGQQAVQAGKDLLAKAGKFDKLVKADAARKQAGVKSVQAKMGATRAAAKSSASAKAPASRARVSRVMGDVSDYLGAYCEALSEQIVGETHGEILGDRIADILIHGSHNDMRIYGEGEGLVTDGDPDDVLYGEDEESLLTRGSSDDVSVFGDEEGLVTDGDPDDVMFGQTQGFVDEEPGVTSEEYYTDEEFAEAIDTTAENNYGLGAPPTRESVLAGMKDGIDYQKGPDMTAGYTDYTVYETLPKGTIMYDGTPQLSTNCIASWSMIYGGSHNAGLIYGGQPPHWIEYRNVQANDKDDPAELRLNKMSVSDQEYSLRKGYGPLVGNPGVVGFGGLQRGPKDTWFWFFDQAPDAKKIPVIDKLLAEAMTKYSTNYAIKKAEAADKVLTDLQEQADYEKKLKQDARDAAADTQRRDKETAETEHQAELSRKGAAGEAAAITEYEEASTAVEEKRTQLEEERYARMAQAEDERAARDADRQAEREQRELENLSRLSEQEQEREARELETLARLAEQERESQARYPSAQADAEEGGQAPEEQYYNQSGEPVMEHEEGPLPSVEDVFDQPDEEGIFGLFGNGRAIDRIRARIRARKAS